MCTVSRLRVWRSLACVQATAHPNALGAVWLQWGATHQHEWTRQKTSTTNQCVDLECVALDSRSLYRLIAHRVGDESVCGLGGGHDLF